MLCSSSKFGDDFRVLRKMFKNKIPETNKDVKVKTDILICHSHQAGTITCINQTVSNNHDQ